MDDVASEMYLSTFSDSRVVALSSKVSNITIFYEFKNAFSMQKRRIVNCSRLGQAIYQYQTPGVKS